MLKIYKNRFSKAVFGILKIKFLCNLNNQKCENQLVFCPLVILPKGCIVFLCNCSLTNILCLWYHIYIKNNMSLTN